MSEERDARQDELIRQNAENIRRNQEALRRQTECLEKIRDHYFPRKTVWMRTGQWFLKAVGAVTIAAGVLEAVDLGWNMRQQNLLAKESAAVAERLLFQENDFVGAMGFLEKAVEYDTKRVRYRTMLAYAKAMATIFALRDVGRPLTDEEQEDVDSVLAEAVFLQEVDPESAMPYLLGAYAYQMNGDADRAVQEAEKAVSLAPDDVLVRANAGLIRLSAGDAKAARREIEAAVRLDSDHPLVCNCRGILALTVDRDPKTARAFFQAMQRRRPQMLLPRMMIGRTYLAEEPSDLNAARAEFRRVLLVKPNLAPALSLMGETYEREGNHVLARLWYDRTLAQDPRCMKALTARARISAGAGDWAAAREDLDEAVSLAPFRADLHRQRAAVLTSLGEALAAADDLKTAAALEQAESDRR